MQRCANTDNTSLSTPGRVSYYFQQPQWEAGNNEIKLPSTEVWRTHKFIKFKPNTGN